MSGALHRAAGVTFKVRASFQNGLYRLSGLGLGVSDLVLGFRVQGPTVPKGFGGSDWTEPHLLDGWQPLIG